LTLAGCPAARDTADEDAGVQPQAESPAAIAAESAEPSVRYLPLDAPAGMAQAVVVEGFPLVHTRQLLPVDSEGKLVGEGAAEKQIAQVLANLKTVLDAAGSGLDKLVRLNVYADSPRTADLVREQLSQRTDAAVRPAITVVQTPLPHPEALVAVDAVALAAETGDTVSFQRCETLAGDKDCADAAVIPPGGVVYLSGQPDKSPLAEAAAKSLTTLLEIVDQLKLERSQVTHVKVFIESATAADEVLDEVKRHFPGQLTPPVVFVEWIASAPVEIEMIVRLPSAGVESAEPVRYYTPPGVKPSPTFSRVAVVQTGRQIFVSGLFAREPGDGEAQVRDVFAQLEQILSATGSDLRHLAKATYYVSDDDASTMLNKLRPEFYDPERPPAASKVTVHGVGRSDRTLTMDMIAVGSGHP
jgi:enamine deaminase RidA (YjgF/YER057c/UK114 family)